MVRCGAGAGLNIEVCGAVRAPALDDGVMQFAHCIGAMLAQYGKPSMAQCSCILGQCWFNYLPSTDIME